MQSFINRILASSNTEKACEFTGEELESLFRIAELMAQIEILENLPHDKEKYIDDCNVELKEILKQKQFEGAENLFSNTFNFFKGNNR